MLRGAKNMKAKQGIMWSRATRSGSYTSIAPKKPWSQTPSHQLLSADISPKFLLQLRFSSSESSLNDCKMELEKLNNALKHVQDVLAKGIEPQKPYESPLLTRAASYRDEFLSRIVSCEGINETTKEMWDKFPYYINKHDKNLLIEHMTARLKENKCSKDFGKDLKFSGTRILLQSTPGTEVYRETLVRTLARHLKVPLLVMDSELPPAYGFIEDKSEEDEDSYGYDYDSNNDENDDYGSGEDSNQEKKNPAEAVPVLEEGDRIQYTGPKDTSIKMNKRRTLSKGQRGEVCEVKGDSVAVIFYENGESDGKISEPPVHWLAAKHIQRDTDAQTHDCYLAMDVLFEVLESHPSIMVYFPDSFTWLPERSYWSYNRARKEFFGKVKEMFDQLSKRKVLIYGQNKSVLGSEELELILKEVNEDVNEEVNYNWHRREEEEEVRKLFPNIISIVPPKDKDLVKKLGSHILEDEKEMISRRNISAMQKVLKEHDLVCKDLELVHSNEVDKIVAWATNHHLSSCHAPSVKNGQLHMPRSSFEHAILRLKESETKFSKSPMPCKGMLLFGPPGTGKTLIAKALATEAGAHFINVTPSSLGSKWYGESENLTKALFTLAVKLAPTIIFLDEIDALLGARGKLYEGEATRKVRNEFMSAWDGLTSNDCQRILVLGASNRPFDLDDAVIRRMPRRIHVDLPDVKNRLKILEILLAKEALESGFDIKKLAEATEGYSGSDLKGDKKDGTPALRQLKLDDFINSKAAVGASVAHESSRNGTSDMAKEEAGKNRSIHSPPPIEDSNFVPVMLRGSAKHLKAKHGIMWSRSTRYLSGPMDYNSGPCLHTSTRNYSVVGPTSIGPRKLSSDNTSRRFFLVQSRFFSSSESSKDEEIEKLKKALKQVQDVMKGIECPKPYVSPLLTRAAGYRDEFVSRIVSFDGIHRTTETTKETWDKFPYYINEHDKNLLIEYMTARLNEKKCNKDFGKDLESASGRILLQSTPGTEVYRETLVRTLAKHLKVPLLVMDSAGLPPPYGFVDDKSEENKDEDSWGCYESDDEEDSEDDESEDEDEANEKKNPAKPVSKLEEGDRIKYVGPNDTSIKMNKRRILSKGQRGEVREIKDDKVAVIFYASGESDGKSSEPPVHWLAAKHIKHDTDAQTHDCYLAMDVLCEVLESHPSIIVYFPDHFSWLPERSYWSFWKAREKFFRKVKEMFDQLTRRKVLIYGQNKSVPGSEELECILKGIIPKEVKDTWIRREEEKEKRKPFPNIISITPPKEKDVVKKLGSQILEDEKNMISGRNISAMHRVLNKHDLVCKDLELVDSSEVDKIVGWATNHHLSSCHAPSVENGRLHMPKSSLEHAILRLKESENKFSKSPKPCKGMLLFGPPGTGKTLIAKALATEAGAHFINVTPSSLTSKWYGEEEQLVRALFSLAVKLAPTIIFVDEIDALLGARGERYEHEATRKLRNEFMSAWDGLTSSDSQRIVVLGASNRPFDLDDAVIRRMPRSPIVERIRLYMEFIDMNVELDRISLTARRIHVDLPDVKNRLKILEILLAKEALESGFDIKKLAEATEGYSGSDLKGDKKDGSPALRQLKLDDFINSKATVGPSVAYESSSLVKLREWNERYGEGGNRRNLEFMGFCVFSFLYAKCRALYLLLLLLGSWYSDIIDDHVNSHIYQPWSRQNPARSRLFLSSSSSNRVSRFVVKSSFSSSESSKDHEIEKLKDALKQVQDAMNGIEGGLNKPYESPLLTRAAGYRDEFVSRIVSFEGINETTKETWDNFPYYINEHDKNLLIEYMTARLNEKKCSKDFGKDLESSSGRILLRSTPGTEVYRETIVRTLAKHLKVPLLVMDSSGLPPPYGFIDDKSEENKDEDWWGCCGSHDDEDSDEDSEDDECEDEDDANEKKNPVKPVSKLAEGDRIKYIGPDNTSIKMNKRRTLSKGQRGELREVKGDKAAVIFYASGESDGKSSELPVHWLAAKHIEHDTDAQTHDCYLAMDVLCEVLESHPSIVVYFPDHFSWLPKRSYWSFWEARKEFFGKVKEMFDQLPERKVLIYGQNKSVPGSEELESILKGITKEVKDTWRRRAEEKEKRKPFPNIISIVPPKEKDVVKKLGSQILEDEKKMISGRNISAMHRVLNEHDLMCKDLELKWIRLLVGRRIITSHHATLLLLEHAILRLKESENKFSKSPKPCKGMLLFGPPGTGKTLIAKALATEAGAHFINVTPSSLTSMWYGEEEQLVRALFSLAVKLAPTIIFVDEIDALLGARGQLYEHEATRRLRNEFMSAWDGLTSNDSQRILVLGASNRPFDLDDAVIRRMPRRIHVDLPDVKNRLKILEILVAKEALESGFDIKKLADATEGYSGSDLKGDKKEGDPALRPLKLEDFINSMATVGPSVAYESSSLVELREWNERFGEGGSRRKSKNSLTSNKLLEKIVAPEDLVNYSWENFPYYINEHDKNVLIECVVARLKRNKCSPLVSSSGRISLRSFPGTNIFKDILVRTVAKELRVPLLVLDDVFDEEESDAEIKQKDDDETCEKLRKLINEPEVTNYTQLEETKMIFPNAVPIGVPTEDNILKTFCEQIHEDWKILTSRNNLSEMRKVLKEYGLKCNGVDRVNTDGLNLNKQKAEKIIGWATNHYLFSCDLPSFNEVPQESVELAVMRLKELETELKKEPSKSPKPCKGLLLFGPPGTGKTLMAKALATESGANFINITPSSLTSMWYGDEENLTRGLFSFARKLAPVIIFVDEIDALLGARGGNSEHEATRRLRNEFMACWDGLTSKDNERILVIGATNRPFDLDDAVIRRMPRRIYVDLPDVDVRLKILKVILAIEELENGFSYEQLAKATETYIPVQDFLEEESKAIMFFEPTGLVCDPVDAVPKLRPLKLDDFIHSKTKIDALLGARGQYESDAIRKVRNEFMSAWDGLTSNDSQRILVLGASNRPFDLDDAVIRRMPRRIHVDLPDVKNRLKILEILVAKEALESGFDIKKLAEATEGYSGSDLKGEKKDGAPALRPLKLEDFINSKATVGPSVANESSSLVELKEWNERFGEGGSRRKSKNIQTSNGELKFRS
ncbi:P-loop containing nucleoside triphosphatehydrolases superfamily protein, partial [Striga asiatica]